MNRGFLRIINNLGGYQELLKSAGRGDTGVRIIPQARQLLAASLFLDLGRSILLITARPERSQQLKEELSFFLSADEVLLIPEPDYLPSQPAVGDPDTLRTLSALTCSLRVRPIMVVTSVAALRQRVVSSSELKCYSERLRVGTEIELMDLERRFYEMGYERQSLVELPATMSRRGGILDIFPLNSQAPLRIEFFGNTVEGLRLFDPQSQRSMKSVEEIEIGPARLKVSVEASLFEYLPEDILVLLDEPEDIRREAESLDDEADSLLDEEASNGNRQKSYIPWGALRSRLGEHHSIMLERWSLSKDMDLGFTSAPVFSGQIHNFLREAKELLSKGCQVVVVSQQAERLAELFEEDGIFTQITDELVTLGPSGSVALLKGSLGRGWILGNTYLFTDNELFGLVRQRREIRKAVRRPVGDFVPGDYVVHVDHGIARFKGLATLEAGGSQREYLVLEYAGSDRLYVPSDQLDRVERYTGAGDRPPALSRLDGLEWSQTKGRAQQAAAEVAKELLSIYATREVAPGFAFSVDTAWQEELESSFPYMETPDQLRAIEEVKKGMEAPRPMDRLVCGDVGYGKTEVALRAAFKAVMDGKQVAFLVPTTILAEQHYLTFTQRLGPFPVKVARLSRLQDARDQREIIRGLADGSVDICIGTHRLIQKDVSFKDLGLLIIDEEQRFGVLHKEFLKKVRHEVDILTLSATPIPRTLYMSLAGVKDMSLMETPPEGRQPIRSFVGPYDHMAIRRAVTRELERGGQVFFVHNRIHNIEGVARELELLLPGARIAVVHGRMEDSDLEKVMVEFARGDVDVLVTTTIIESGLDVPNANTMIIDEADKLGLTQLYQLWGRVGRGSNQAYVYFLYANDKRLTPEAEKRLETMLEVSKLGAGFDIALRDLEIRGAGDILGLKQSGHISAVGFNAYCRLLAEAVAEERARLLGEERKLPPPAPVIDLPLKALLPDEYVGDVAIRIGLYRRLLEIDELGEVEKIRSELEDRFGALPEEAENLLYMVKLKVKANRACISSVVKEDGEIVIRARSHFEKAKLQSILSTGARVGNTQIRIELAALGNKWQQGLEELLDKLALLIAGAMVRC